MVATQNLQISTSGQGDVRDVTRQVGDAVSRSGMRSGIVTVFAVGSTAGMTTIEFEAGAIEDLNAVFEQLAPREGEYRHHLRWGDDNGSSHVRAGIVGPSLTVPFVDGAMVLGTWQQIVLVEFDTRARSREVVVQIVGE
jgi:secondary thiamine-phosphate synthase enzyme